MLAAIERPEHRLPDLFAPGPFCRLSFSSDNGVTWEKTDTVLPPRGGDNPPKLVVLPDGKALAAFVHSYVDDSLAV